MSRRREEAQALAEAKQLREAKDAERVAAVRRMAEREGLTVPEMARRLGVSANTARRLAKLAGVVPRPGGNGAGLPDGTPM